MPAGSSPDMRRLSAAPSADSIEKRPLHGQQPREQDSQPEQAWSCLDKQRLVLVEGKTEQEQDDQGVGHHLVEGHFGPALDPQVLAGYDECVTPHWAAPGQVCGRADRRLGRPGLGRRRLGFQDCRRPGARPPTSPSRTIPPTS